MRPIPDETISLILNKVDIVDIIGDYVQLRKSGKNHLGLCPFHAEKTPSFSVSAEKQLYHCFGCGASGNVISFLMNTEGYTFPQAVYELGLKAGVHVDAYSSIASIEQDQHKNKEKEWMQKAHQLAAQLFHHMLLERSEGRQAREYLESRGFQVETIREFQIGYAPDSWDFLTSFLKKRDYPLSIMEKGGLLSKSEDGDKYFDRFRGRVMFPICNSQGKVVAFGGRIVGEGAPKYLNSPETPIFRKGKHIFNLHRSRSEIRQLKTAILFEGYMDAISAWQAGIRHGIATLGTALSEDQARIISRNAEQVIICFDGDQSGLEASVKAAEIIGNYGCLLKVATLPSNLDPDEFIRQFGAEDFQKKIIKEAKSFTAFYLELLKRGKNLQDDGEKIRYISEAIHVVSKLSSAIERDHYLRQLAEEFSLSLEALKQEYFQIARAKKKKQPRDKDSDKWNTIKYDTKHLVAKGLVPAFQQAERILLAHMLKNREVALQVQDLVGSEFNLDEHCALAAYLYAYYAEGHHPDLPLFLTFLDDSALIKLTTELSMITISPSISDKEIQDCTRKIFNYQKQVEIDRKEEEKRAAERQGEFVLAAQIATEILQMKNKL